MVVEKKEEVQKVVVGEKVLVTLEMVVVVVTVLVMAEEKVSVTMEMVGAVDLVLDSMG